MSRSDPGSDGQVEHGLLGCMLLHPETQGDILLGIEAQDFEHADTKQLYGALLSIFDDRGPAPREVIARELRKYPELPNGIVEKMATEAVDLDSLGGILEVFRDRATERRMKKTLAASLSSMRRTHFRPADVAKRLIGDLSSFAVEPGRGEPRALHDIGMEFMQRLESGVRERKVPTGFADLDELLAEGLYAGNEILIAGRPSQGKTTLACNIADSAATKGHRVLFCSLEMSAAEVYGKLLTARAGVDLHRLRIGVLEPEGKQRLKMAAEELRALPLRIDDSGSISVAEIAAKARRLKVSVGLDLLIVDYLQLLRGNQRKSATRNEAVAEISRGLKLMGKDLDVAVLAVSQLNRLGDSDRPRLCHLRDSGTLEQDADVVILLSRDPQEEKVTFAHVAKNRLGPTAGVKLVFETRFGRFRNYSAADDVDSPADWGNRI